MDKYQAETECGKYRKLYEAKLKQEAEEMKERKPGDDENKPLRSGKRKEDKGGKD